MKKRINMQKGDEFMKKASLHIPGKLAQGYLRIAMFMTLLAALALLFSYQDARAIDPVKAAFDYAPLLEYIMASVFIALGGTLVLELVLNDPRFQKKK